jgi:hypothetical protein
MFHTRTGEETKLRCEETIIRIWRRDPETGFAYSTDQRNDQGTVMIKALSAVAIAACIASALTVLPGFAPQVEASVPQALAKGDRLAINAVGPSCSQKAWPNFEASCLRVAGTKTMIKEARLVTADRTP